MQLIDRRSVVVLSFLTVLLSSFFFGLGKQVALDADPTVIVQTQFFDKNGWKKTAEVSSPPFYRYFEAAHQSGRKIRLMVFLEGFDHFGRWTKEVWTGLPAIPGVNSKKNITSTFKGKKWHYRFAVLDAKNDSKTVVVQCFVVNGRVFASRHISLFYRNAQGFLGRLPPLFSILAEVTNVPVSSLGAGNEAEEIIQAMGEMLIRFGEMRLKNAS